MANVDSLTDSQREVILSEDLRRFHRTGDSTRADSLIGPSSGHEGDCPLRVSEETVRPCHCCDADRTSNICMRSKWHTPRKCVNPADTRPSYSPSSQPGTPALNPKSLGLTIAAMAAVGAAGLSTAEEIGILVVFVLIASIAVAIPATADAISAGAALLSAERQNLCRRLLKEGSRAQ